MVRLGSVEDLGGFGGTVLVVRGAMEFAVQGRREPAY
jgi:hypothetical protein